MPWITSNSPSSTVRAPQKLTKKPKGSSEPNAAPAHSRRRQQQQPPLLPPPPPPMAMPAGDHKGWHSSAEDGFHIDSSRSANFNHKITKHQHIRAKSASSAVVVVSSVPRHDRSRSYTPPIASRNQNMGSVMGPGPAYMPQQNRGYGSDSFAGGQNTAPRNFTPPGPRPGRPESMVRGNNGAPIPQPRRMPSMQPGSYAQFDNRPVSYNQMGRPAPPGGHPMGRPPSGQMARPPSNGQMVRPPSTGQMSRPTSSSSNGSSVMSRESYESGMRTPVSSHRTSFGSWDSHPRRPEYGWQRPAPIKQQRRRALQPGELCAAMPDEVFDLIMSNLRTLHMEDGSFSCATCMMRDICSVSYASKKLLQVARRALYGNIELVGSDSAIMKKRYKINFGSRMVLLRRTLRANPEIAAMVRTLKAPMQPLGMPIDQYANLAASIIMACPNFERLIGPHQAYDHNFNRLFHALSTREKLKEMTWVVEPSASQQQHRRPMADTDPEDLLPQQSTAFLEINMHWKNLTTLSIHCLPGAALTPVSLVATAISTMPSLKTLHLSNLSQTSFDDTDLLALPKLQTLSLSSMAGITGSGLSTFASRPSCQTLKSLRLEHMEVNSLAVLARIFIGLTSLESFTFVQNATPLLPEGEEIWLFPYMVSQSLKKLHWDITGIQGCANFADSILSKSIAANGFPKLCWLRTPNDPEGIFQKLCRPVEKLEKPNDKYRTRGLVATIEARPQTPKTPTTPGKSPGGKSPYTPAYFSFFMDKKYSDLHAARLAAQKRLEEARKVPRFEVNVIDEDGTIAENWWMAGFMGECPSQIEYHLLPDVGASDDNGGLVLLSDIVDDRREDLSQDKDGCTGRWNNYGYINYDKKGQNQEKWWHTERARWTEVRLS